MIKPRSWDWTEIIHAAHFKRDDEVLETGAMFGYFSLEIAPAVKSIIVTDSWDWATRRFAGVDGNPTGIQWATEIGEGADNTMVMQSDIQELGFDTDKFDKVVCISAIEHVKDDRKGMEEMMRVLKPNGLLLLTTEYNPLKSDKIVDTDGSFYRIYDTAGIDRLTEGFHVVEKKVAEEEIPEGKYTTILLVIKK